jgi:hypothetical protein
LPSAQEITDKDVLATGVKPGTPKFQKTREEMILTKLDARPKKVPPPEVPQQPPPGGPPGRPGGAPPGRPTGAPQGRPAGAPQGKPAAATSAPAMARK